MIPEGALTDDQLADRVRAEPVRHDAKPKTLPDDTRQILEDIRAGNRETMATIARIQATIDDLAATMTRLSDTITATTI